MNLPWLPLLQARSSAWQHLGLTGPVIRAAVGDKVRVHLKNINYTNGAVSFHAHGLLYHKSGEGAPYMDGSTRDDIK